VVTLNIIFASLGTNVTWSFLLAEDEWFRIILALRLPISAFVLLSMIFVLIWLCLKSDKRLVMWGYGGSIAAARFIGADFIQ